MHSLMQVDVVVIGSGPAGQKAAVQAAKAGRKVVVVERDRAVGGACVSRGTIPSKTLRESALRAIQVRRSSALFESQLRSEIELADLMSRVDVVVSAHADYMGKQLERNGIQLIHGKAKFLSPRELEVRTVLGSRHRITAPVIVVATGSRPRTPPECSVDHENIFDSDSILSMMYLPGSLSVLGGGVIASEYASIFASLGVNVTMIDRGPSPLRFMDPDLVAQFVGTLEQMGGRFLGNQTIAGAEWDGATQVVCRLGSGEEIRTDKMLVALGRESNLDGLDLALAGLAPTARGLLQVDANCQTAVPGIYAVGDVIGPPALAASAMEQGRRAICHALGLPQGALHGIIPVGIYTIPEMASVGLSVEEANLRCGGAALVGKARFDEVARGQISAITDGLLKLICDARGRKLLGVHIVGEGACELIHLGQVALAAGWDADGFVDHIFNFPTLAEAYRVAALDVVGKRSKLAPEEAPQALAQSA